jgi:hypothetical protein
VIPSPRFLRLRLSDCERRNLAGFVIGFGITIITWASLHDIYLIGVEPRHFTEYHRSLLPITNHTLLALQYATVATLGPGMVFGALAFACSRLGRRVPLGFRTAWLTFLPFVALIEITALLVGRWAASRNALGQSLPYPDAFYPDTSAGIAYTQSVNVTAYLAAAVFGTAYQLLLVLIRVKRKRAAAQLER